MTPVLFYGEPSSTPQNTSSPPLEPKKETNSKYQEVFEKKSKKDALVERKPKAEEKFKMKGSKKEVEMKPTKEMKSNFNSENFTLKTSDSEGERGNN